MKKNKKNLIVLGTVLCSSALMLSHVNAEEKSVPVNLYIEATPIDVTLPESVNMRVSANSYEADVDDITIINNSLVGVIEIRNIHANAVNDYTKVENTSDFKTMPMNSKQVSLQLNDHDLYQDYQEIIEADPESSQTLSLSGKSSPVTQQTEADNPFQIVITVGYK